MTKEEALKAMIDGKKVRHKDTLSNMYFYYNSNKTITDCFRLTNIYIDVSLDTSMRYPDGYEIVKEKVKKYRVVYKSLNGNYYISSIHYKDREDFDKNIKTLCFIHLIEDSMIEVEEYE